MSETEYRHDTEYAIACPNCKVWLDNRETIEICPVCKTKIPLDNKSYEVATNLSSYTPEGWDN